jgi:hypothetical protein
MISRKPSSDSLPGATGVQDELARPKLPGGGDVLRDLIESPNEVRSARPLRLVRENEVAEHDHLERRPVATGRLRHLPHLPGHLLDARQRDTRGEPTIREPGSPPKGAGCVRGEVDRWMGLLNRLRLEDRLRHVEELPVELDRVGRPDRLEHLDEFVGSGTPPSVRGARRFVLILGPALAEAHPQPPAR